MTPTTSILLAAAAQASAAATDMIEAARDGANTIDNNDDTETLTLLADSLRLLIEAMGDQSEEVSQLMGAVTRYLDPLT